MVSVGSDFATALAFVRKVVLSSIYSSQSNEQPESLNYPYSEYSRRVAVVVYEIKYGIKPPLLGEVTAAIGTIVKETRVRAITITWEGGENHLYPLFEELAKAYSYQIVDDVLLPMEE